jgi:hypothetical protein
VIVSAFSPLKPVKDDDDGEMDIYTLISENEGVIDHSSTFIGKGGSSAPDIGLGYYYPTLQVPEVRELFIEKHLIRTKILKYEFNFTLNINGTPHRSTIEMVNSMFLSEYRSRSISISAEFDYIDVNISKEIFKELGIEFDLIEKNMINRTWKNGSDPTFIVEENRFGVRRGDHDIAVIIPSYERLPGEYIGIEEDTELLERIEPDYSEISIVITYPKPTHLISSDLLEKKFEIRGFKESLDNILVDWPILSHEPSEALFGYDAEYVHYWELEPTELDVEERELIRSYYLETDLQYYFDDKEVEISPSEKFNRSEFLFWCEKNLPAESLTNTIEKVSRYIVENNEYIMVGDDRYVCVHYARDLTYALEIARDHDPVLNDVIPWYIYSGPYPDYRGETHAWVMLIAKGEDEKFRISFLDPTHADTKKGAWDTHDTFVQNLDAFDDDHYFSLFIYHVPEDLQDLFLEFEEIEMDMIIDSIQNGSTYNYWIEGRRSTVTGDRLREVILELKESSVIYDSGTELIFIHGWENYEVFGREYTSITYQIVS